MKGKTSMKRIWAKLRRWVRRPCRRDASPPKAPSLEELKAPSLEESKTPSLEEPKLGSLEEPKAPPLEELKAPSLEELKAPSLGELKAGSLEELKAPSLEEPKLGSLEKPKAGSLEELKAPSLEEPKAPSLGEPKAPSLEEPKALSLEELKAPSLEELKAPSLEELKALSLEEPKVGSLEEPKAPPLEEPKAPSLEEPKAPSLEEGEGRIRDSPRIYGRNSRLENLPSEMRRLLLSHLSVEELHCLVFASPVMYRQYLLDRRYLLCKCLEVTLQSVAVGAHAVHLTSANFFSPAIYSAKRYHRFSDAENLHIRTTVAEFVASYHTRRAAAIQPSFHDLLNEEDAISMCRFHLTVIVPLLQHFATWALGNLALETKSQPDPQPLTPTERARLMRGFYHFELCCNLYGRKYDDALRGLDWPHCRPFKVEFAMFKKLEPWEVEEIACVYPFIQDKYERIFNAISWDVDARNPKFGENRCPTPDGAFDLDVPLSREWFSEGVIMHGLKLLIQTFTISDHALLVSTMQEHLRWRHDFLKDVLEFSEESLESDGEPCIKNEMSVRRTPFPFLGDTISAPGTSLPPFSWILLWRGTYSKMCGIYVPAALRLWGYIIWDASRIKRTGAEEILEKHSDDLLYYDPRENLY
ncbi:hypothetical protein E4U21_007053 [Claviceps maximensis]|nr:hypothetical protein E4U21_007053 [Claviceps maximensis]